ncbi:MAG: sulfotransferase [Sedimenticola sp.]
MHSKKAVKYYEQGLKLYNKGRLAESIRYYKKALKISPDFTEAIVNLGNIFLEMGRLKEACSAYRRAVDLHPTHPMLLSNLGNAHQLLEENNKAIHYLNKAITSAPDYADAHNNLGNTLRALGRFEEAIASYESAARIQPAPATYNNLGCTFKEYHNLERSIASFRRLIELDPEYPNAYLNLGDALADSGDLDEAITSYRKAIAIDPLSSQAYRELSRLRKFTECDEDIHSMEKLYAERKLSDEQRMNLGYGLGKAYEDIKEYEKAMHYTIEANRLMRSTLKYSTSETEAFFSRIKDLFSAEFFSTHAGAGESGRTPLFILGMSRSGTTLTEQILASHPMVYGAGELNYLPDIVKRVSAESPTGAFPECIRGLSIEEFQKLGRGYITAVRRHSDNATYIIDKMQLNFMRLGLIKVILPDAKVIHLNRDPMDNCLSIFKNYFSSQHDYSFDMKELGEYYKLYQELMNHWRSVLPGFIYDLSYEQLVSDNEREIRKLLEYCDLPWDEACLSSHKTQRSVATASKAQVRRPVYQDSVQLWKRYEEQLEPLRVAIYD